MLLPGLPVVGHFGGLVKRGALVADRRLPALRSPLRAVLPRTRRLGSLVALVELARLPLPRARRTLGLVALVALVELARLPLPRTRSLGALVALVELARLPLPRTGRTRCCRIRARAAEFGPRSARVRARSVRPGTSNAAGRITPEAEAPAWRRTPSTTGSLIAAWSGVAWAAMAALAAGPTEAAGAGARIASRGAVALPRATRALRRSVVSGSGGIIATRSAGAPEAAWAARAAGTAEPAATATGAARTTEPAATRAARTTRSAVAPSCAAGPAWAAE